jgi:hypothetical protein
LVGSTSSAAIPISLFVTHKYLGLFSFKKTSYGALIKKRKYGA